MYVCTYIYVCICQRVGNATTKEVVDEVGDVMAFKCPRPHSGPLNGVQAITVGGCIDNSSPIFHCWTAIHFLMCTHLDSTLFAYGGLCLSVLEVDGQVFRRSTTHCIGKLVDWNFKCSLYRSRTLFVCPHRCERLTFLLNEVFFLLLFLFCFVFFQRGPE